MQVSCISYCTGSKHTSKEAWLQSLMQEIQGQIAQGCEIILYPELFFLDLYQYFSGSHQENLKAVSQFVLERVIPTIDQLKFKGLLCLGTFPRVIGNQIFNSCPISVDGRWVFQDKIHLTPWETDFTTGNEIQIFRFKELNVSVLICFDVEQPQLAQVIKEQGIHLMLVPSATADRNGSERVLRCSTSRSIELGAAVLAAPLVGTSTCDLIDASEGRQGLFLPSQSAVKEEAQTFSAYTATDHQVVEYKLDTNLLIKLKIPSTETKPYLEKPKVLKLIKLN